jgi:hypothetical protein
MKKKATCTMSLNARADRPLLALLHPRSGLAQRTFLTCDGGLLLVDGMMVNAREIP